ncbi:MAG: hypothetical protein LBD27_07530 [Tannerella sp.]|jgi:hypothetical protein|nr:hypothetical protein [Tannerella sp.]
MRKIIFSNKSLILVDIVMTLELCAVLTFTEVNRTALWRSPHCIIGAIWIATMTLHVIQHWRMVKSLTRKKILFRNKISALTTLFFVLTAVSILPVIIGINNFSGGLHGFFARVFLLFILIHIITKFKMFTRLFKKAKRTQI